MAAIDAGAVKRLREATGMGIMECKTALKESEGDFDLAIRNLREKGAIKGAKLGDVLTAFKVFASREDEDDTEDASDADALTGSLPCASVAATTSEPARPRLTCRRLRRERRIRLKVRVPLNMSQAMVLP